MSPPDAPSESQEQQPVAHPTGTQVDHDLLLRFVEDADDLWINVDTAGAVVAANSVVERICQVCLADLVGRNVRDLVHPDDERRVRELFARWRADAPMLPTTREVRMRGSTATPRIVRWTASPLLEGGELTGFVALGRDVTDRRRMERALAESETIHAALLSGSLDPVVSIDAYGTIVTCSDSVERVFGWLPDELVGRNVTVLMPEPHFSRHDTYLESYRHTGESSIIGMTREFVVLRKDGTPVDVELSVSRVEVPGRADALFIGSFRDITERKQAEDTLKALAHIGESASILAHEIKNPITGINLALRAVADALGEDEREVLTDLLARMRRLEQLIRQTLGFARPLRIVPVSTGLTEVVHRAVHQVRTARPEDQLEITTRLPEQDLVVTADAGRTVEVLVNLLTNAADALGGRGRIEVRLTDCDGQAMLEVDDAGPGVLESLATELFLPFRTGKEDGTGLGLAICRRIAESHGGSLELTPGRLGGACFRFTLPTDGIVTDGNVVSHSGDDSR